MSNNEPKSIGGSVFWILIVLASIMSLSVLGFWGYQNQNIRVITISVMYAIMILFSIVFSIAFSLTKKDTFHLGTWRGNAISFSLGFIIWLLAGTFFGKQSFISLSTNHLLKDVVGVLPQFIEYIVQVILVPIAEELFWMFGIAFALFTILNIMGKRNKIFKNPLLQLVIIAVFGGVTFALFHIGNLALTSFLIGAFIFRAVMIVFVYGEQKYDWIKGITLLPSFAIGSHIANNLIQTGMSQFFVVVNSNFFPLGLAIYLFFVTIFLSAIIGIVDYFGKKSEEII